MTYLPNKTIAIETNVPATATSLTLDFYKRINILSWNILISANYIIMIIQYNSNDMEIRNIQ